MHESSRFLPAKTWQISISLRSKDTLGDSFGQEYLLEIDTRVRDELGDHTTVLVIKNVATVLTLPELSAIGSYLVGAQDGHRNGRVLPHDLA